MTSVSVEGRGSLVDVEGFSILLENHLSSLTRMSVSLNMVYSDQWCSMMAELGCLASVCSWNHGAKHSGHLTNVFIVTVTIFYLVYHSTLFLLGFVFGDGLQGPYGVERFVVR